MPSRLNSIISPIRQVFAVQHRRAAPETQVAVAPPLSSSHRMVNQVYRSFLEAARNYGSDESSHTYAALRRLHEASRDFERTFTEAAQQDGETTRGDMDAAIASARAKLPVQPSQNRAVLMPLLREVQTRAGYYAKLPPDTAAISNEFPALYAAVTAYLEALGAQPLHQTKGLPGGLSVSRPRLRTHEDLHEQALRSLQPRLFENGRRQTQSPYTPSQRNGGDGPPDYLVRNETPGLPPDLDMRIRRSIKMLHKPIGSVALDYRDPAALLNELKSLLGSEGISVAERGEILDRLARNIPSAMQMGGREQEKLARLFLRFLAPERLPGKYRQAPAAVSAGLGTENFNPEALVAHTTLKSITLLLIGAIPRFGRAGKIVCDVLGASLERSRKDNPSIHAGFLRQSAIAINQSQSGSLFRSLASANTVILPKLVSVIVDEINWLDQHLARYPVHPAWARQTLEELNFEPEIRYNLRGLPIPNAAKWDGRLNELPAFMQLRNRLTEMANDPVSLPGGADDDALSHARDTEPTSSLHDGGGAAHSDAGDTEALPPYTT